MNIEAAYKTILEYLQRHGSVNTFRLSRHLKTDRAELIKLIEELTREGLTTLKSGTVRIYKERVEKKRRKFTNISIESIRRYAF